MDIARAGVDALEPYDALFVDHDHGPPRGPRFLVEYPVELRHFTMGIEVAQDGVRYVAQRGRVGRLRGPGVRAYTQYLSIPLLEFRVCGPKRGDLVRSTAGKGVDVPGEDDVLSPVLAEGHLILVVVGESEIRGGLSYFCHRLTS